MCGGGGAGGVWLCVGRGRRGGRQELDKSSPCRQ